MKIVEHLMKHWVYKVIVAMLVLIGGTWTVFNEILLKPKDEQIKIKDEKIQALQSERDTYKQQLDKISPSSKDANNNYSIPLGESIVLQEGKIMLNLAYIFPVSKTATLKVVTMSDNGQKFIDITPEIPAIVNYENNKLSISLLRIRGNIIDITAIKQ